MDKKAEWIWLPKTPDADEYASFKDAFSFTGKTAVLRVCAETNYVAYLNGKVVGYGQYAGYPTEKYYDEIDLTPFCTQGENALEITVWYEGFHSFTHVDDGAGLCYAVLVDGETAAYSGTHTLCALDSRYESYRKELLTIQVGYKSKMTNVAQQEPYAPASVLPRQTNWKKRPVKKLQEEKPVYGVLLQGEKRVYDLGKELCGYPVLEVDCKEDCEVLLSYGEYLADDGNVPRLLGGGYKNAGRDFSFAFACKKGVNRFVNRFVRLAGRYLQIETTGETEVQAVGIVPAYYPMTERPISLSGLDRRIYDTCLHTLRLCMHEHYEDCPWREQSLYALDSRNQMLCGYAAFEETDFARANLVLMAKGTRADGLLELTYPAVDTPAIPFFSLIYPVAVWEYVQATGDESILDEVWETLSGIMDVFAARVEESGLLANFPAPYWNFYEWTKGSDGDGELVSDERTYRHDLILNCAYVYACQRFEKLCALRNVAVNSQTERAKRAIHTAFFDEKRGRYFLSDVDKTTCSQLGNAFALLIGLGDESLAAALIEDETLTPATLSMLGFVYDALLKHGDERQAWILADIRKKYKTMLDAGATTFWETLEGVETDKSNSLCHGWSAIPVHYYRMFEKK